MSSLKNTAKKIHGAGDAIRGSINVMADRATGDHATGSKNEAVLNKGVANMNAGQEPVHSTTATTATTGTHTNPHGHTYGHGVGHTQPEDKTLLEQGEQARHGHGVTGTTTGVPTHGAMGENLHSTNHGPHSSNIANKADPRIDSDLDGRGGGVGYNTSTTTGQYGGAAGGYTGENLHSTNHGPHSSNVANMADPRIDSDRDGRAGVGAGHRSTGVSGGAYTGENLHSTSHGPHSSNIANKADPRVDSDLDGSGRHGSAHHAGRIGAPPAGTTTGIHTHDGMAENPKSSNHGPHSSKLLNKLDPRVDSKADNTNLHGSAHHAGRVGAPGSATTSTSATTAPTTTTGGYAGENPHSANHGPHASSLGNKADPRIDSDRDNRGVPHGAPGAGQPGVTDSMVSDNHGPHSSSLANKLDPRVDSDMDGRAAPEVNMAPGRSAFARNLQS